MGIQQSKQPKIQKKYLDIEQANDLRQFHPKNDHVYAYLNMIVNHSKRKNFYCIVSKHGPQGVPNTWCEVYQIDKAIGKNYIEAENTLMKRHHDKEFDRGWIMFEEKK